MYKKITHTIVEEHFGHPLSADIKSSINRSFSKLPTDEIFDFPTFSGNMTAYARDFATKITSMIDSISTTDTDFIIAYEGLASIVDQLGNATKPLYYSEYGEQINLALRNLLVHTALAIHTARIGGDTSLYKNRINMAMNDLANVILTYNSSLDGQTVRSLTTIIGNYVNDKIVAAAKKDTTTSQNLTSSLTGVFGRLATVLADAAKARFPERFAA